MVTPEQLALFAGVALSLAAFYLPYFGPWYNKLGSEDKVRVMGYFIVAVGAGSFVLGYFHVGPLVLPPGDLLNQIFQAALAVVAALVANQSTYTLFKKINP